MYVIKDNDPYAISALYALVIVFIDIAVLIVDIAIIVKLLILLTYTSLIAFAGMFESRFYLMDETGITVVWYGFFKHKFEWSEFKYVRVHILHRRRHHYMPYIVCSHRQIKKLPSYSRIDRFVFHPLSSCVFEFSPERMDVLEKFGVNITYYSKYSEIMRLYEEDLKNWGIR